MEENKRAGSYNVAESSIRYFTNSGNSYNFDRHESLSLTPNLYLPSNPRVRTTVPRRQRSAPLTPLLQPAGSCSLQNLEFYALVSKDSAVKVSPPSGSFYFRAQLGFLSLFLVLDGPGGRPAVGRPARRSRPSGFRLYDHRRRSRVSRAGSAEWVCVSSAQGCRGAMAAPRGEAAGHWDHGSIFPHLSAAERLRRPRAAGLAEASRIRSQLSRTWLSARAPLVRAAGAATLPRRLSSLRRTLRGGSSAAPDRACLDELLVVGGN